MKSRVTFKERNPTGAEAMNAEIRRQCVELNAEYELELDALVLWTLHEQNGWGCVRLMRFYEGLLSNRKKMHDFYSGDKPDKSDIGIEYFDCYAVHITKPRYQVFICVRYGNKHLRFVSDPCQIVYKYLENTIKNI